MKVRRSRDYSRRRDVAQRPSGAGGSAGAPASGAEIRVEVTGLAPGGDAVGRQLGGATDGRVTFVPLAAPGEVVRARLVRERARVAWAELAEVEAPSPARVGPRCPLFGRCGGCQWQHVDDRIQRSAKGDIVARAVGLSLTEATPVGPSYGYRERVRLAVAPGEAGDAARVRLGFRARRSHEIVDVPSCPLLAPALDAALADVRRLPDLPVGRDVALLVGRGDVVAAAIGDGRGLRWEPGRAPAAIDPADPGGWPDVAEPGGRPLLVPPRGFAQVGRAANAALVAAVKDALGSAGRVLELCAGSGNFTRQLVAAGIPVLASDADADAVARGRRNVPEADWRPAASLSTTVLPVDTVLVDPPREGLDERSLALAAAARRVVYVSCDPQTLGRDVGHLLRRGLRLEGAVALDLMPQTYHVEVVALFTRR